jgi:restriction system protein
MAVWLVRAGKHGEQEQTALDANLVTIGWNGLPDLSDAADRATLEDMYARFYSNDAPSARANKVGQVWAFRGRVQAGDLVVLPLKTRSAIAVGRVVGPYSYRTDLAEDIRHTRPVEWLRKDLPRTAFDQDLLYSLGAFMTVCQIRRNNAEERIRAILGGGSDPGGQSEEGVSAADGGVPALDIEQVARDQMLDYIRRKFAGHRLASLVDAVLKAEGYLTRVSPPGPDGGVDILAGNGPMGFGPPRLCVQVKSGESPVDVNVLRSLQGILAGFHADQGLLVSWGGFRSSVLQEARQSFFTIRLWDSGDLLGAILKNHDKFSDELQTELPVKRIWALVLED